MSDTTDAPAEEPRNPSPHRIAVYDLHIGSARVPVRHEDRSILLEIKSLVASTEYADFVVGRAEREGEDGEGYWTERVYLRIKSLRSEAKEWPSTFDEEVLRQVALRVARLIQRASKPRTVDERMTIGEYRAQALALVDLGLAELPETED